MAKQKLPAFHKHAEYIGTLAGLKGKKALLLRRGRHSTDIWVKAQFDDYAQEKHPTLGYLGQGWRPFPAKDFRILAHLENGV